MKKCERCPAEAQDGMRFCKPCSKDVLAEMQSSGYLQYAPRHCNTRPSEAKELTRETKFGTGH